MIKNLKSEVNKKIKVLIKELSPYVAGHGGELEFVGFDLKLVWLVYVLKGLCAHCALSPITLRFGLLKNFRPNFLK